MWIGKMFTGENRFWRKCRVWELGTVGPLMEGLELKAGDELMSREKNEMKRKYLKTNFDTSKNENPAWNSREKIETHRRNSGFRAGSDDMSCKLSTYFCLFILFFDFELQTFVRSQSRTLSFDYSSLKFENRYADFVHFLGLLLVHCVLSLRQIELHCDNYYNWFAL